MEEFPQSTTLRFYNSFASYILHRVSEKWSVCRVDLCICLNIVTRWCACVFSIIRQLWTLMVSLGFNASVRFCSKLSNAISCWMVVFLITRIVCNI
ncbi:unnamed protein product [Linum tenue]|uniref:Uncharacterized protein n=1 Tax=Linum tenue TaxID=586396 RepID=A0AAV0KQH6_9ROSI|nr:unnamed protein product [Linum tenue]